MPRLDDPRFAPACTIRLDGTAIPARAGEPIAAALLAAGRPLLARSPTLIFVDKNIFHTHYHNSKTRLNLA